MTARELIVYILSNGLENEPVCKNGKLIGFMTPEEAATKFGVGVATINIWFDLDMLDGIDIGGNLYIPCGAKDPRRKE